MNSDQDCLTNICKLPEETNSVESSLTIKTGGSFVQEDQDRGLRDELNTNSNALALLNRQTGTNTSDQCMFEIVQFQKINNSVHVRKLLFVWNLTTLAEKGRKLKSFAHGAEGLMDVELLTITGRALE